MTSGKDLDNVWRRAQRDQNDLQDEIAGRDTGRARRFLAEDGRDERQGRTRKASATDTLVQLTALELALQDTVFAQRYAQVMDMLSDAERRVQTALDQAEADLADANAALTDMEDRANRLPDGRAVFQDADGTWRTADGAPISDHDAASIVPKDGAASWDDYRRQQDAAADARRRADDARDAQVVLGDARDRMEDPDDPPSMDDLDDIQRRIEETLENYSDKPGQNPVLSDGSIDQRATAAIIPDF